MTKSFLKMGQRGSLLSTFPNPSRTLGWLPKQVSCALFPPGCFQKPPRPATFAHAPSTLNSTYWNYVLCQILWGFFSILLHGIDDQFLQLVRSIPKPLLFFFLPSLTSILHQILLNLSPKSLWRPSAHILQLGQLPSLPPQTTARESLWNTDPLAASLCCKPPLVKSGPVSSGKQTNQPSTTCFLPALFPLFFEAIWLSPFILILPSFIHPSPQALAPGKLF